MSLRACLPVETRRSSTREASNDRSQRRTLGGTESAPRMDAGVTPEEVGRTELPDNSLDPERARRVVGSATPSSVPFTGSAASEAGTTSFAGLARTINVFAGTTDIVLFRKETAVVTLPS